MQRAITGVTDERSLKEAVLASRKNEQRTFVDPGRAFSDRGDVKRDE